MEFRDNASRFAAGLLHTRRVEEVRKPDLAHLLAKCARAASLARKQKERESYR